MNKDPDSQDTTTFQIERVPLKFGEGQPAESEHFLRELIQQARSDEERYALCLYYGEILLKLEKFDEARDVLHRSAQIAIHKNNDLWLARSHEKLGELLAIEENWFGAVHHYQYALQKGKSLLDPSAKEQLEAKANDAQNMLHSTILPQDTTIIPLSKEYSSGSMAISFVHRDVFLKTFFARCLECSFCYDQCCSYGADVDIQNVTKIRQRKEEILPFVRPPEGEWFDVDLLYYEEYAGGEYTRIKAQGPRCVFISKDQRGCGLHRYAISKGMDYHEIKPLVCILFPLSFGEGVLSVSPELEDSSLICSGSGISAYQAMRNELEYYFGQELVEELDRIEKEVLI